MSEYGLKYSKAPVREVKSLQFGVLSPEDVRAQSVLTEITNDKKEILVREGVTRPETYDFMTGEPVKGGLSDERFGSMEDREDPGFFGHIVLSKPVYHVGFLSTIVLILRCIGYHSTKLLVDKEDSGVKKAQKLKGRKRLHAMMEICKTKRKDVGGADQPNYRREGLQIIIDWTQTSKSQNRRNAAQNGGGQDEEDTLNMEIDRHEQGKRSFRAAEALNLLKNLKPAECLLLGFNPTYAHPKSLIITVLPVPPPHVRPSVAMNASQRCEDDITHKLADIVKANAAVEHNALQNQIHIVDEYVAVLQWHVATLVDNALPYAPRATQKSGKPLKTLRQRIVGKEGRVRGNLMGKRVDFTARTVITADPNLSIDQVGVPRSMALHLTVPERVTHFNKERLRKLVRNGPDVHPGARYVVNSNGTRTDLRYNQNELHLKEGDVVERHLANDDVVLFNRQPSLHRMSIMAHRVRVLPWSTFRLNLSCTTPYNADFDGDEMNMHVPQSVLARAEAETFMMVNKVIVSPQSNRPVMGIVQDALLSSSLMTRRDVFVTKEVLYNILIWVEGWTGKIPIPAVMLPVPNKPGERITRWTGKQVFSLVVPTVINMNSTRSNGHDSKEKMEDLMPNDTWVLIDGGQVLTGMVDKNTLGNRGGGLIHVVCNECGPEEARMLFNQIQKITNYWVLQRSYTVGVGDTVADKAVMNQVNDVLTSARSKVAELVKKGQRGELEMQPGKTMEENFEDYVNLVLNKARDDAGQKAEKSIPASNGFKGTVQAGSKGSFLNIAQIMACVGQQNVDGKRIPYGFDRRTLPHFAKDDLGPESRGFVENSYLKGLSPQEFFFHAMGGRVGLIDTACKTAETGYIQRRLVKALEDVSVRYDGTVRNGRGDIVQFLYGEDGMDGAYIESQNIEMLRFNDSQMKDQFKFDVDETDFGTYRGVNYMENQVISEIRNDMNALLVISEEYEKLKQDQEELRAITKAREPASARIADKSMPLPVNLARFILNVKKRFNVNENAPSDLRPDEIIKRVRELEKKLLVVGGSDDLSKEAQDNATALFFIHLRSSLASKVVLKEHRLNKQAFDALLKEIEARFLASLVTPGEMCGVLAAQSIGEPATQMTLNTFHHAGVSAKNVTLGVPRLKEIINVSTNVKTPSLTVYLDAGARTDRESAETVLNRIEFATLKSFTESIEILFDPLVADVEENAPLTSVPADQYWVRIEYEGENLDFQELSVRSANFSPFVLRIVLNPTTMGYKKVEVAEIVDKIKSNFRHKDEYEVISTPSSGEAQHNPVIRIRRDRGFAAEKSGSKREAMEDAQSDEETLLTLQKELLENLVIRGIRGIPKVFIREDAQQAWDNKKGFVPTKQWVLDTEGTNLKDVMAIAGVDFFRTVSNDITQTLQVLGIEAVRRSIFNELRAVISFDGSYVNYRHLALLVDVMCSRGYIMAITRHGINRTESGALMRASFEETVEILMEAAAFSECDSLAGVSENIMLGKLAPAGTGVCQLVLDETVLEKHAIEFTNEEDVFMEDGVDGRTAAPLNDGNVIHGTPMIYSPGGFASPAAPTSPSSFVPFSPSGISSPGPGVPMSPNYQSIVDSGRVASGSYFKSSTGGGPGNQKFSTSSPVYSPSSPVYSPSSPAYSPSSVAYSPSSPAYSPSSPAYSPSSPAYSPSSPAYSPSSPAYSPSSPAYSPSSPAYSPSSPAYSPSSPAYSPSSPAYSPSSPAYSPSSPAYSPSSPAYSPSSPAYSPSSPAYSPSSPAYSPNQTNGTKDKAKR